jgi:RimJ/RimL family protein N-acetyltransferase
MGKKKLNLDKFISGENLDLCIPTEDFAENSNWYTWFNNQNTTKYLEQGLYPNTKKEQKKFLNESRDRIILIIKKKDSNDYIGTISLSNINHEKKICDIALVFDLNKTYNLLTALESIALVTEHAFEKLGIKRISAGQHIKLSNWQQMMELVGYKLEGIHIKKFIKGNEVSNSVSISCLFEDYEKLKKLRGKLYDGNLMTMNRIRKKKKIVPYIDLLDNFYKKQRKIYYNKIFKL